LKKRCWDGEWDLFYSNLSGVPGFRTKKHWSAGHSCNEMSRYILDIKFPEKEKFSA